MSEPLQGLQGLGLSPQQRRLWAVQGESPHLRSRAAVLVSGELPPDLLREAWAAVVARHEILRTTFRRAPGIKLPVQVIAGEAAAAAATVECVPLAGRGVEEAVAALWAAAEGRTVDLGRGPLVSLSLATLSPGEHLLLLDIPALCADRVAIESLVRQIGRASAGRLDAEPPLQYGDLSQWLNDLLEAEETEPGRAYWQGLDLGSLTASRLPGARRPVRGAGFSPRRIGWRIAPEVTARIGAGSAAHEVPPSAFLLACWCVLLGRLTGQPEVIVGVGSDGRRYEEIAEAVGLFARFLPLSCRLQAGDRLVDVARRIEEGRQESLLWQEAFDLAPPPEADDECGRWPFGFE
ncbi:MAG: hypothetical protein QOJ16_3492, partial [Acidobacteriota bacterium]|nr:hypothetical protein [Acidobacteriota bacterium]